MGEKGGIVSKGEPAPAPNGAKKGGHIKTAD